MSKTGRRFRVHLVDNVTGERQLVAEGQMHTAGEVIEEAIRGGCRRHDIAYVFRFIVKQAPTPERISALWHIMCRSPRKGRVPRWQELDGRAEFSKWLPTAVNRRVKDRDKDGLLVRGPQVRGQLQGHTLPPDKRLERKEAAALAQQVRARLRARILKEGTARDRRIYEQWVRACGVSKAEIARAVGVELHQLQSFERKILRWGEEERETLQDCVPRTRVSAT